MNSRLLLPLALVATLIAVAIAAASLAGGTRDFTPRHASLMAASAL